MLKENYTFTESIRLRGVKIVDDDDDYKKSALEFTKYMVNHKPKLLLLLSKSLSRYLIFIIIKYKKFANYFPFSDFFLSLPLKKRVCVCNFLF